MSDIVWKRLGVFAFLDSGVPPSHQEGYTTLVIVHGFAWPAGVFSRMFPFANKTGSRVVIINRRGYPGSEPFADEDRALLASSMEDTSEGLKCADEFMKQRAEELHDFLVELVKSESLAINRVMLAGWSLGASWMTAFLANAASFDDSEVKLHQYLRRVIAYDAPAHILGYPYPQGYYYPLNDPSISLEEGVKRFPLWVTSYYDHGNTLETLSLLSTSSNPLPTITGMTPENLALALYVAPAAPDGTDGLTHTSCVDRGLYAQLRKATLYPPPQAERGWSDVEFRCLWCDRSNWLMPWGRWALEAEVSAAKESGANIREISVMRMRGSNHFAHWDEPERTLRVLLSDSPDADL
ncbi:alpha/beta-hydrolase [Gloeopeniophorella convolvens]|nr:alpha/beta-hydrolase [Gloeopeniophorella convolvens]